MLDDFIVRAAIAVILIAFATAPVGCFVVWRRMAFFGDAIAHSAVFGVSIALLLSLSVFWGILLSAVGAVLVIAYLSHEGRGGFDTHLGVVAHCGLALGLVMASFVDNPKIDLFAYLFGDILAISKAGLLTSVIGVMIVWSVVFWRWRRLLTTTLNPDLARAEGINPHFEEIILLFLIALIVAIAIKITGVFLIVASIIIPAATAHRFARTPFMSVILAVLIGVCAAFVGLAGSFFLDIPAGPSIVVTCGVFFFLSLLYRK